MDKTTTTCPSEPCTDRFLAVSDYAWGRGATAEAAKRVCRRNGGRGRLSVYLAPEGATDLRVDGMGSVRWGSVPGELLLVAGRDRREGR